MKEFEQRIRWLLKGDISLQYQTTRDLLGKEDLSLQAQIHHQGWGKKLLGLQKKDTGWGQKFYQPKWTSTHYTLLDLRNLNMDQNHPAPQKAIDYVLSTEKGPDGGVRPIGKDKKCDVCLNGMFLNYACYFKADPKALKSVIDFTLDQLMPDGGFNCLLNTKGAKHSSLHSTISVMEGLFEYDRQGYSYKIKPIRNALKSAAEFILLHQLFISDRTGKVIHKDFLKLSYPHRWKYNILRALDFFRLSGQAWDERMRPAIEELKKKQLKDGRYKLPSNHPGKFHFPMEKVGEPSRWNTLLALRVFKHYDDFINVN